jgi:hypothetical protein
MEGPINRIYERAASAGFFKRTETGQWNPTAKKGVVNLEHADILSYFNSKIRGILNYYSFVDNRKSLGSIIHGLKHSCALTLALKFKLRRRSKVFKKFGSLLKCKTTGKKLFIPKTFARTQEFSNNPQDPFTILNKSWANKLTKSNLFKACLICNKSPAEMHHVRKISNLEDKYKNKKLDFWTLQMAAINRKQIPLCREHHHALHNKKLSEKEKETLRVAISKFLKN